jgi:hypothetical protein
MNATLVREILERANVQFALIGAAAVALRGLPRFTQDTDFLTTDHRVLERELWEELIRREVPVEIRKGDYDDPLGGIVRIGRTSDQVDVVVGKYRWEQQIIERAEPLDLFGGITLVPMRSDLILLKLAAGGYKDLVDAAGLLSLEPRHEVITEINSRIGELPEDAQTAWTKLIAAH